MHSQLSAEQKLLLAHMTAKKLRIIITVFMHLSLVKLQKFLGFSFVRASRPLAAEICASVAFYVSGEALDCLEAIVTERALVGFAVDMAISDVLD